MKASLNTIYGKILVTEQNDSDAVFETRVRNCCLCPGPKLVDFMWDQQLYNLVGPMDQQHFIVTKL